MRIAPLLFAASLAGVPAIGQNAATTPVGRMAAEAHPTLTVAAIHLHDPNSRRRGFNFEGSRYVVRGESVESLIMFAYAVHRKQILGGPEWLRADRYDIEGKPDVPGEPNLKQQQEMLQKLLAERFSMHVTRENRDMPVYAIQIAKGGPKLTRAAKPDSEPDVQGNGHGTETTLTFTSVSLDDLPLALQFVIPDRPVINQTSVTGRYDFSLRYTPDEARATDPNAPPGIFTAIQEQLGLKLQPVKAPVDVLVIDAIERPSEN